jgi:hypothetical protein
MKRPGQAPAPLRRARWRGASPPVFVRRLILAFNISATHVGNAGQTKEAGKEQGIANGLCDEFKNARSTYVVKEFILC